MSDKIVCVRHTVMKREFIYLWNLLEKETSHNTCVFPSVSHSAEKHTLTNQTKDKLAATRKDRMRFVKHRILGQNHKHLGKIEDKGNTFTGE